MPDHSSVRRDTILGLVAILLWSGTVALARSTSQSLGPWTSGGIVYTGAGLLLAAYHLARVSEGRDATRLSRRYVLGCGALFAGYALALFLALASARDHQEALEVGLVNYLWPALTLLFSLFILGNRATPLLVPGTLVALAGVFLVLAQGASFTWESFRADLVRNPAALSLGLAAAVAWGLYSNLARRWGAAGGRGAVHLFALATGAAFWVVRLLRSEASAWSTRAVCEAAALALATALAYAFWDRSMRGGNVVLVAACSYLTPLLSTAAACLYLGVRPGAGLWWGCAGIVAGSLLSGISVRPRRIRGEETALE